MPGFAFARQLAANFGRADYFSMLRSMSSTELDHWFAHYQERPMHQEVVQWQLAHVAAGIYQGKTRPSDFMPQFNRQKSLRHQVAIWKSLG